MKLEIRNLSAKFDKKTIFDDINFTLKGSGLYALIGANGAGKSTFLKAFINFNKNYSGEIYFNEERLSTKSNIEKAKFISYMAQFDLVPKLNVYQALSMGRRVFCGSKLGDIDKKFITSTMDKFSLNELKNERLDKLSGGQRQKVMIAASLLQDPKILLLDEPISHLDPKNQHEMLEFIKGESKNRMVLIVLHDLSHAIHFADELIMLKDTKLLGIQSAKKPSCEILSKLYDVEVDIKFIDGHAYVRYSHKHDGVSGFRHTHL
ncbi:MAG: ABC transporter ATP-binding protein [Campylobacter sp.]|nr:ABC transporter ATP-binding protein [Campylobacter sp.]